jgi:hypothetical protein
MKFGYLNEAAAEASRNDEESLRADFDHAVAKYNIARAKLETLENAALKIADIEASFCVDNESNLKKSVLWSDIQALREDRSEWKFWMQVYRKALQSNGWWKTA